MNAIGYQGIFEAAAHKLNDVGGVMLWKLNAAFPSVVWQVYDWYLLPNAGYYFMQNACEPVHIQFNPVSSKVMIINRTFKAQAGLKVSAEVFGIDSKSVFKDEVTLNMNPSDVKESTDLSDVLEKVEGISFVILNIKNSAGQVISHNAYWLSKNTDYRGLNGMEETRVSVSLMKSDKTPVDKTWKIKVSNTSGKIAFFIRPQLMVENEEVLPSFWSGAYFTLAPGESTEVSVSCPSEKLNGKIPHIRVSGWNIPGQKLNLL
jgi:hypothetical protein